MKDVIKIGKNNVYLNFDWQKSQLGKVFRFSAIIKVNKPNKKGWYYVFKTKQNKYFSFYQDQKGNFKKKLNNNETIEILC